MATLPQRLTPTQMAQQWASQLNPILKSPTNNSSLLTNIPIITGTNVINHKLGRQMQGWIVTDINAAITLYRTAPLNDLTLTLTASGPAVISLEVF